MTDRNSPTSPNPSATTRRRSSITAFALSDAFGRPSFSSGSMGQGPITSAAAEANRRRLSLSTSGMTGGGSQTSPFGPFHSRTASMSSANSGSVDESPFEDGDGSSLSSSMQQPTSPFARRMSFGAQAMRNMHGGSAAGTAAAAGNNGTATTSDKSKGQGFSFAESMRSRAERSSISAPSSTITTPAVPRHKSIAQMEPPVKEIPQPKRPDVYQERMLKGDFYMD